MKWLSENQCAVWMLLTNLACMATGISLGIFFTILQIRKERKARRHEEKEGDFY
jgi:hypothetical protein